MKLSLKTIEIKDFNIIKDVKLNLTDTNILIGENGTGKSSFLYSLEILKLLYLKNYYKYAINYSFNSNIQDEIDNVIKMKKGSVKFIFSNKSNKTSKTNNNEYCLYQFNPKTYSPVFCSSIDFF